MNSCDNLIESSRNTYLFRNSLKKIMLVINEVAKTSGASAYLSADRDDGKIYLNVEWDFDDMKTERWIKNWIQFNHEIIEIFHIEYTLYEKRYVMRIK